MKPVRLQTKARPMAAVATKAGVTAGRFAAECLIERLHAGRFAVAAGKHHSPQASEDQQERASGSSVAATKQ